MKAFKVFSLFFVAFLVQLNVYSQDMTTNYYSYMHNFYNLNPAYCAIGHTFAGILDVRQKSSLNSTNSMLGINGLLSENQGIGTRIINDIRGPFQTMLIDATYGYKLKLDARQAIYFGLSAGIINKSINTSRIKNYSLLDQDDPTLNFSNFKSTSFTSGAGIIYEFNTLELALSFPQIVSDNKKSMSDFNAMAANIFHLNEKLEITPMLLYFNAPVVKNLASFQCKAEYSRMVWLQLGYQSNAMFNACAGFEYSNLGIAYNFMTSNKLMNVQTSGTHEVILTLRIGRKSKNPHYNKMHPQMEHIE